MEQKEQNYLSAMAVLDPVAEDAIRGLKRQVCKGLASCDILPVHMTLGMYVGLTEEKLLEWAEAFARTQPPVPLQFTHLCVLGSRVLSASPAVSEGLLALHRGLHSRYDEFHGEVGAHYALDFGAWVPHCTLFMGEPQQVQQALGTAMEVFVPFAARIERVSVGRFSPLEELHSFPLAGRDEL